MSPMGRLERSTTARFVYKEFEFPQRAVVRGHCYSVVRRRKKRFASGAATARISADQASDASMGCCISQAPIDADGFGLRQSGRAPAVTALTGFQSARVRS